MIWCWLFGHRLAWAKVMDAIGCPGLAFLFCKRCRCVLWQHKGESK